LYHENAYKRIYYLPNTNPRWPQLLEVLPIVYLVQTGGKKVRGSNLNKYYPVHVEGFTPYLLFESTYAMGKGPELTASDLIEIR
jgi:hypothetical protein